jgi:hypothetical protein
MDTAEIIFNKYTILLLSFIIIAITTYDGINKINSEEPDRENILINMVVVFISLIFGAGYYSYKSKSSYNLIYRQVLIFLLFISFIFLIYWFTTMNAKTFVTFSYLSSIVLILIAIVTLSIIFIMLSNWLKSLHGWTGFFVNFLFYIPCLLNTFVYYLISEFKLTTSPVLILFFIQILLLLCYLYIPEIVNHITNQDGTLLYNSTTLSNGKTEIQDTFFLNTLNSFSLDEHVMPDMKFQINGNRNKTTFQNYAISMWTYVNAHGSNKLAYNTESLIFDYGEGKPKINYYNGDDQDTRDKFRIYFTNNITLNKDGDDNNDFKEYYEMKLPFQRWNNLVFNFSSTHADLFVNGHLERTFSFANGKMPTFAETDVVTMGKNDGLDGAISNVRYYTKTLSKHKITNMYNIFMKKTPPTFNM